MLSAGLSLFGAAVLTWPPGSAVRRLRLVCAEPKRRFVPRVPRPRPSRTTGAVVGLLVLVAWLVGGLGIAVAVGATTTTCLWRWRARDEARSRLAATAGLAEALGGLVAQLRAGAHPASAAADAVADDRGTTAGVMSAVANAARLGGDVADALHVSAKAAGLGTTLDPLAYAWALAQRHGLPLADVLDAVRRDLDGRVRFARQVRARMAGPRASGLVLGVLPGLGVLLGEAMGAGPVRVLVETGIGQTLLAVGSVLACAGAVWIARLTSPAVLP